MSAVPDFRLGGYRFRDLLREGIVSSRGDLNYKQTRLGFPRPIKTGVKAAWFPKSEVHAWLAERARLRDQSAAKPGADLRIAGRIGETAVLGKTSAPHGRASQPKRTTMLVCTFHPLTAQHTQIRRELARVIENLERDYPRHIVLSGLVAIACELHQRLESAVS